MNYKLKNAMFDLLDFDPEVPEFNGLYYDLGNIVAVGHKALAVLHNQQYDTALEGRIVDKDGYIINSEYPDYESLLYYRNDRRVTKIENVTYKSLSKALLDAPEELEEITLESVRLGTAILLKVLKVFHILNEAPVIFPGAPNNPLDVTKLVSPSCSAYIVPLV